MPHIRNEEQKKKFVFCTHKCRKIN